MESGSSRELRDAQHGSAREANHEPKKKKKMIDHKTTKGATKETQTVVCIRTRNDVMETGRSRQTILRR